MDKDKWSGKVKEEKKTTFVIRKNKRKINFDE